MWLMRPLLQHCSSCVKSSFETEMLLLNLVDLSEPMPPWALTVQTIRHRSTEGAVSDTNHFWSPKDHALNKLYSTLRLGSLTRGRTQRIKLLRKYRFGHSWWVILKCSISITAWLGNWWLFAANRMPQGDFATKHKTLYGVIAVTSERCYLCVRSYRKNWKHPLMSWPPRPVCEQFMMFMCPSSQQTVMFVSDLSWNLCRGPRSKNRVTAVSRLDSQCITIVSPSCHHHVTIVSPCHHARPFQGPRDLKGQQPWLLHLHKAAPSTNSNSAQWRLHRLHPVIFLISVSCQFPTETCSHPGVRRVGRSSKAGSQKEWSAQLSKWRSTRIQP